MPFCSNCGNQVISGTSFCGNCGAQISGNVVPSTPPPQVVLVTQSTETKHISRTPEFTLGLIGGILGILFVPVMLFFGAFQEAFTGQTSLYGQTTVSALMSVVGLVGAVFVRSKPKVSGVLLVLSGIIGIIVALGFYLGGVLLLIAGILALVRKDK